MYGVTCLSETLIASLLAIFKVLIENFNMRPDGKMVLIYWKNNHIFLKIDNIF